MTTGPCARLPNAQDKRLQQIKNITNSNGNQQLISQFDQIGRLHNRMKRIHKILVFGAPLAWLLCFLFLLLWVRIEVGHWPSANNPDPKTVSSWWLRNGLMLASFAVDGAMLLGVALLARESYKKQTASSVAMLVVSIVMILVFNWLIALDPYLFFDWFAD